MLIQILSTESIVRKSKEHRREGKMLIQNHSTESIVRKSKGQH